MRKSLWLLQAILILALVLAATASVSAQASFVVEDLEISTKSPKEGDNITISCAVKNTGDEAGAYTLELKMNTEEVEEPRELTLDAGDSQIETFEVTAGPPNDYAVALGDLSGSFTVTGEKASFFSMFSAEIWGMLGARRVVLLLLVIVFTGVPSRKKQPGAATKAQKPSRQAQQGRQRPPTMQGAMPIPTPIPGSGPSTRPTGYPTPMPPQTPGAFPAPAQFQAPGAFSPPGQFPEPGPMAAPYPQYARIPIFSVSNLTITPNQVKAGETLTISAMISNNGPESAKYSVVLRINGVVENIIELLLSAGVSQAISFTVIKDIGGDYYAEVDGLGGAFNVVPLVPASFSVSNLVISPDRVKQGQNITISAMVTNNGEVSGSQSLVLKLKGAVEGTQEISLEPGETQRVDFNITKNTPGFYNAEMEGLTGRFVVEMEWQG